MYQHFAQLLLPAVDHWREKREVVGLLPEDRWVSAVLIGGTDGTDTIDAPASIAPTGVGRGSLGDSAAGPWPGWARPQLEQAVAIAGAAPADMSIAGLLYRLWFSPLVPEIAPVRQRPLLGVFRAAHAGSRTRLRTGSLDIVDRFDLLGPDGWWRTWGHAWTPPRSRRGSVRLMLTPRVDQLGTLVRTVTEALLPTDLAWSLGCSTRARRLARYGGAVLDVPSLDSVPAGLLSSLEPMLHPVAPPLCLPVGDGIGLAEYPDNGMTFGEHRCHLVALALRHPTSMDDPLRAIAAVFAAHDIDPARPYGNR